MTRRATDAEREAVRNMLSDARVAGMITEDEWKERVERTSKVMDIGELQSLYTDVTGTTIPIMALTVTRDWYTEAGKMVETCDEMVRDRFLYLLWYGIPVAIIFAIVAGGSAYGPAWPVYAAIVYLFLAYVSVGVSLAHTDRIANKMKRLLKDAGVE